MHGGMCLLVAQTMAGELLQQLGRGAIISTFSLNLARGGVACL